MAIIFKCPDDFQNMKEREPLSRKFAVNLTKNHPYKHKYIRNVIIMYFFKIILSYSFSANLELFTNNFVLFITNSKIVYQTNYEYVLYCPFIMKQKADDFG